MDDLISRQAAIVALKEEEYPCESDYDEGYMAALKKSVWIMEKWLPSAQPEQRWIPCSERLPDMWDERYLVSLAWGGIGVMEYKSTGFHNYGSFTPVPIESIAAWMPLPEPYKTERRTDNANVDT